jgi:hypothetical protein
MKTLMRALTGLALVGALILALGVQSSGGSTSSTTAGCEVPEYLASHEPGTRTKAGYFEYQAWIANDSSQATS